MPTEREMFEEWARKNAKNLCLRPHSERPYHYADTLQVWEAWQARAKASFSMGPKDPLNALFILSKAIRGANGK